MFERIIENYKYAKANLNSIRFKQKYIFLPILLSFCILDLITCLVLLAKVKNPTVIILVLIGVMFLSVIGYVVYEINIRKKEVVIEAKKLDDFFSSKLIENPELEYVMPRANELGIVTLQFYEKGIKIEDIEYSYDAFDCGLFTSNYLNKVNLIMVFSRNNNGDKEDGEQRGVTQFSMPFNLNMLSIMDKFKIKLKNPDVLRFIKENSLIASKQILKYGKIQNDYYKTK